MKIALIRIISCAAVRKFAIALLICCTFAPRDAQAYSVFTHEEIIDILWPTQLAALLKQRFPGITSEQLQEAHA